MCDRLFAEAYPDEGGKDCLQTLSLDNLKVVTEYEEPSLASNSRPISSSLNASAVF